MSQNVCNSATLKCSFGTAPSTLVVLPVKMINTNYQPAANIMDHKSMVNILPFGLCRSLANPTVAAATAAAQGALTPMPCVPNTPGPWIPGSPTVVVANQPALNNTSKLMCVWAGVIEVVMPGQMTHNVP